jgi:hypothetical protein
MSAIELIQYTLAVGAFVAVKFYILSLLSN